MIQGGGVSKLSLGRGRQREISYLATVIIHQDPPTPNNGQCLPPEDKVSRHPCASYGTLYIVGKALSLHGPHPLYL